MCLDVARCLVVAIIWWQWYATLSLRGRGGAAAGVSISSALAPGFLRGVCLASVVMVMVTDVNVHAVLRKGKGKTVDHIELSIFHQRSTDLNKNEQ